MLQYSFYIKLLIFVTFKTDFKKIIWYSSDFNIGPIAGGWEARMVQNIKHFFCAWVAYSVLYVLGDSPYGVRNLKLEFNT